jgi:hypothetical protein
MATVWKKVLMEGSAIDINDVVGVTAMEKGQILRGDDNGDVENIDVTSNRMIFGGSSDDALLCSFGNVSDGEGEVLPSLTGEDGSNLTGTVTFTVSDAAIGTAKLVDDAVTLAKIAHGGSAGVMIYDTATGVPTFLDASGSANKVLKVNGAGDSLTFEDAASATSVSITDSDSGPDTTRRRIMHGGTTTAGDEATQTVFGDTEFTYKNQEQINGADFSGWNGTYTVNDINNSYEGADTDSALQLPATAGISATLVGTARASMYIKANSVDSGVSNDAFYDVAFMKNSNVTGFSHVGYSSSGTGLKYNPKEQTLKVQNLIVDGNQTTINSTNLAVEDQTIRLGIGATETTDVTSGAADGTGIIVNIGRHGVDVGDEDGVTTQNAENTLPRIVWENGQDSTKSVLGWKMAFKGAGADSSLGTSSTYGIGVMHTDSAVATTALGADLNDATLNIGIGAMALVDYDGTPELYIQTAV